MDSEEIIGSINKIYARFDIPPNLRMHMYRVTAVAEMVCSSWKDGRIDKENIVAACLTHDLGNMVRLRLENSGLTKRMMGEEAKNIEHWKQVQKHAIARYGKDDQTATRKMLIEINADKRVISLIADMFTILHNEELMGSNDPELRICEYADMRVGPFGIISVKDRMADLRERHTHVGEEMWIGIEKNYPRLEKWICRMSSVRQEQINDKTAEPYIRKYQNL